MQESAARRATHAEGRHILNERSLTRIEMRHAGRAAGYLSAIDRSIHSTLILINNYTGLLDGDLDH